MLAYIERLDSVQISALDQKKSCEWLSAVIENDNHSMKAKNFARVDEPEFESGDSCKLGVSSSEPEEQILSQVRTSLCAVECKGAKNSES